MVKKIYSRVEESSLSRTKIAPLDRAGRTRTMLSVTSAFTIVSGLVSTFDRSGGTSNHRSTDLESIEHIVRALDVLVKDPTRCYPVHGLVGCKS